MSQKNIVLFSIIIGIIAIGLIVGYREMRADAYRQFEKEFLSDHHDIFRQVQEAYVVWDNGLMEREKLSELVYPHIETIEKAQSEYTHRFHGDEWIPQAEYHLLNRGESMRLITMTILHDMTRGYDYQPERESMDDAMLRHVTTNRSEKWQEHYWVLSNEFEKPIEGDLSE